MNANIGNYVRVSIEDSNDSREYLMGQIVLVRDDTKQLTVKFHDIYDKNQFFDHIPKGGTYFIEEVERCKIKIGSLVIYKEELAGKVIDYCKGDDINNYKYYLESITESKEIIIASEIDITAQYDNFDYNPINQLLNYEFHNPVWYRSRSIVSESNNAIKNSPIGFELLLGSRVFLFPHQINAIIKGFEEDKCRLMLADEVGLGKTIEACVIVKGLMERDKKFKTLIIVPYSLANQWKNELSYKFWEDSVIWSKEHVTGKERILILPLENIKEFISNNPDIKQWNMCIVDETHRLLINHESYKIILELSKTIENVLLLSATPIQKRKSEYLSLLMLLNPTRYINVNEEEFDILSDKSEYIRDKIYDMVMDLNYYYDDELEVEFIERLEDLNEKLEDDILEQLIEKIDIKTSDKGLEMIKIILAYVSNTYEIEKDIIRNRRIEISDKIAARTKEIEYYSMQGSSTNFYEIETYDLLVEYVEKIINANLAAENKKGIRYIKVLLSSFFSTPWALLKQLDKRKSTLSENQNKSEERLFYSNELNDINNLVKICLMWKNATQYELDNLDYYEANPELIQGRLMLAIDHLDQNYLEEKLVIFSQWTETAKIFEIYMSKKYGSNAVVGFYKGKSMNELEIAVNNFQNNLETRFLICDPLGGEGRNFQMADAILHLDTPWYPIELEQRIGRLDRIGRDSEKEVKSIILLSEDTIEEDLFNLWDIGLNIFGESLSGIEIALGDVEDEIERALYYDIKYGLRESIDKISSLTEVMRLEVEKERYFDRAKNLDPNRDKKINYLIEKYDQDGGRRLYQSMNSWAELAGLNSKRETVTDELGEKDYIVSFEETDFRINSAKKILFYPPDTRKALKRSRRNGQLTGTFSTSLAVNREDLIFFSPGEVIFDSIIDNSINSYKGRCTAVGIKSDFDWMGLVFTWNTEFSLQQLIDSEIDIINKNKASEFLIIDQITTYHPLTKGSKDISLNDVTNRIIGWQYGNMQDKSVHLGKRTNAMSFMDHFNSDKLTNIEWFKSTFNPEIWEKTVMNNYKRSQKIVKDKVSNLMELDIAKEYFEQIRISNRAKNIYYSNGKINLIEDDSICKINNIILEGLEDLDKYLDSVMFVWMVKE